MGVGAQQVGFAQQPVHHPGGPARARSPAAETYPRLGRSPEEPASSLASSPAVPPGAPPTVPPAVPPTSPPPVPPASPPAVSPASAPTFPPGFPGPVAPALFSRPTVMASTPVVTLSDDFIDNAHH